jgi:MFS superfamily sulfate permease-like transporter
MQLFKTWGHDVRASLVVFLIALPLCIGIAFASNAPLSAGLFAGIVGGLVVGAISGSPISVSGPAAGLSVIVATTISELGNYHTFALAVFFMGLIQIFFGLLRGGRIGDYFPASVINGMVVSIGLILILKQLPHAVGYDVDYMGDEAFGQLDGRNTFSELLFAIEWLHWGALITAAVSIAILVIWEKGTKKGVRFFSVLPSPVVAVLVGVLLNALFKRAFPGLIIGPEHLVRNLFEGGIKDLLAGIRTPDWSSFGNIEVYKAAVTMALVGSIETLLTLEAADKLAEEGKTTSKNRELVAHGIGNTILGLIGGLPVTAVLVRTSANSLAGAKSRVSTMLHGAWLLIFVVAIPWALNLVPLATLAGVLLMVGARLATPMTFRKMIRKGPGQYMPFFVTIFAVLFTNFLFGIMIGAFVGFFFVLRSNSQRSIVVVSDDEYVLVRFHKDVSFFQKSTLARIFTDLPHGSRVLIDGSRNVFIDGDIVELIEDFIEHSSYRDITVELKRSSLARCELFKVGQNG